MLSVTFSQPIVIEANVLASLLSLANVPATVEPYLNGNSTPEPAVPAVKRVRKPAAEAAPAADGAEKPKRTRRTKAEMEALRAGIGGSAVEAAPQKAAPTEEKATETTEAGSAAETTKPVEAAPEKPKRTRKPKEEVPTGAVALDSDKVTPAETVSAEGLLERFAKLIDADFAAAKKLLDEFGVNRFSDLQATDHAAFQAKLAELGV